MPEPLIGGCFCGAVRYECSARPLMCGNCHCRDCQKSGGGGFVAVMVVPAASLKIHGRVKYFESKAAIGNTFIRGFCRSATRDCSANQRATRALPLSPPRASMNRTGFNRPSISSLPARSRGIRWIPT